MNVRATYQYFKFDPSKVKVSNESYRRYVKPQARNISAEFYFLIKSVSPKVSIAVDFRSTLLYLIKELEEYRNCQRDLKEDIEACQEKEDELLKTILNTNQKLFSLNENFFSNTDLKSLQYDNYLNILKQTHKARNILNSLETKLQLKQVLNNTNFDSPSLNDRFIHHSIINIESVANLIVTEMIPADYKSVFDEVFYHYIIPIEKRVIQSNSSKWLVQNLGKLNLAWNTFHMSLDKGGIDFPKKHVKLIKIMHNRWNSILKIIF